jgi:hypothetical protein
MYIFEYIVIGALRWSEWISEAKNGALRYWMVNGER